MWDVRNNVKRVTPHNLFSLSQFLKIREATFCALYYRLVKVDRETIKRLARRWRRRKVNDLSGRIETTSYRLDSITRLSYFRLTSFAQSGFTWPPRVFHEQMTNWNATGVCESMAHVSFCACNPHTHTHTCKERGSEKLSRAKSENKRSNPFGIIDYRLRIERAENKM